MGRQAGTADRSRARDGQGVHRASVEGVTIPRRRTWHATAAPTRPHDALVEASEHGPPVSAVDENDLHDRTAVVQARHRADCPVPGMCSDHLCGGCLERTCRPRHDLLLALGGGQVAAVRDYADLHDGPYAVVNDDLRESISLEGVNGELERAVVDLILGRDGCAFTPAHGHSTFEGKPCISQLASQRLPPGGGARLGESGEWNDGRYEIDDQREGDGTSHGLRLLGDLGIRDVLTSD